MFPLYIAGYKVGSGTPTVTKEAVVATYLVNPVGVCGDGNTPGAAQVDDRVSYSVLLNSSVG